MANKHMLGLINRLLREVMTENIYEKNEVPFGGKVIILGGDFRHCLPVLPNGSRVDILDQCIKALPLWNHFT